MKIGIDVRALLGNRRTGVEEYSLNLLEALFVIDKKNEYILFSSGLQQLHNNNFFPNNKWQKLVFSNRALNISYKFFNYPKIDKWLGEVDVFFSPNINLTGLSKKCRKVITFHDLSFIKYPQFYSLKRQLWHSFVNPKKLAREADKIIAISQSTKEDLIELFKIKEEKISVVYSGIGKEFKPIAKDDRKIQETKNKYNLPDKFILYLGTLEPRKNIAGLMQSFDLLKQKTKNSDIKLVIAGEKGWLYKNIFSEWEKLQYKEDIIFIGFVDVADKPYLYNLAEIFVFPSFYEGFGFPPLEAIACGVPTITSNFSSLPEVVGEGAILVDPYNIDELALIMEEVLADSGLREKLKQRGRAQAAKFSWEKCARETLDNLEHI